MTTESGALPPHYRRNFALLLTGSASFWVMMGFVSISTVVPVLVSKFTNSAFLIGSVGALFRLSWMLPQMAIARIVQDKPLKKPFLYPGIIGRSLSLLLVPAALLLGVARYPGAMLVVIFLYLALFSGSDSIIAVPWSDILARAIPLERRGRLFGWSQAVGQLAGVGVGVAVGAILGSTRFPFPRDYALLFVLGFVSLLPSAISLPLLKEPPPEPAPVGEDTIRPGGGAVQMVMRDPSFRRLILCRMLVAFSGMASGFYVVHAADVGQLPEQVIGQFVMAQTIGGLVGSLAFGRLSERRGPLWVIRAGSAVAAIGPIFALVANAEIGSTWTYIIVFMALGTLDSVWMQGFSNYVIEIAPGPRRPVYVGTANTILSLSTLAPIFGGWLLQTTSYTVLFGLTTVVLIAGFVVSLTMRSAYKTARVSPEAA